MVSVWGWFFWCTSHAVWPGADETGEGCATTSCGVPLRMPLAMDRLGAGAGGKGRWVEIGGLDASSRWGTQLCLLGCLK